MSTLEDLRRVLVQIDGRGYKAYKDIKGQYDCGWFELFVDHVQGDPFASPSKIRVRVSLRVAAIPYDLWKNQIRRIALRDFLARTVARSIRHLAKGIQGIGRSGEIFIDMGGQEVLERTAVILNDQWVEARLEVGLPAKGRTVLGRRAEAMLCGELPQIIDQGLLWASIPQEEARHFVEQIENYDHIRQQLKSLGLVAFIADGSVLPRASGVSDHPLVEGSVQRMNAPESLRVTVEVPNAISGVEGSVKTLNGLGIPHGVTLIVGGGYHGKSTLLHALQRGVYPHIPGDGREYVVTLPDAVKIRAEDGRRIEQVDISGFISNLPQGQPTNVFSTDNASGSTSQAATILEALEVGAPVLLMDEDTSATNFMVRDARMQALVSKECEPITPFLDRVQELYNTFGVSTVLVMGGCGDYFDVADTVIMMRDYLPIDVSHEARRIADNYGTSRQVEVSSHMRSISPRIPLSESIDPSRGRRGVKITVRDIDKIEFGNKEIVLRGVEQLIEMSQTRAVGCAIHLAAQRFMDGKASVKEIVEAVEALLDREGLDVLDPFFRPGCHPGNFAKPRSYEITAALNRLRTIQMRQRL